MNPIIRVIDCFIFRKNPDGEFEYLLLHRAPKKMYNGHWRMVGGKIKSGEKAWETAIREMKEETGLSPIELWSVPYVNQFYEWEHDRINSIPVFIAKVDDSKVVLDDEHDRFRWVSETEAAGLLLFPGQIEGLRASHLMLTSNPDLADLLKIKFYDQQDKL